MELFLKAVGYNSCIKVTSNYFFQHELLNLLAFTAQIEVLSVVILAWHIYESKFVLAITYSTEVRKIVHSIILLAWKVEIKFLLHKIWNALDAFFC